MAVAFSRFGDTPASLTRHLFGYDDDAFAQQLWHQNARHNCCRLGVAGQFAPGYAVWVPENKHIMGSRAALMQMPHFDALLPQSLAKLAAAQDYGFNPQILLGAHELACRLNHSYFNMAATMSEDPAEKSNYLDQAASFALTASHTGFDVRKNSAVGVSDKIKRLNKAVLDERGYRRSKSSVKYLDKDKLAELRGNRIAAMKDMQSVNQTMLNDRQATYLLHKSDGFWDSAVARKKWHLSNVFDTADLATASKMMEHVATGLLVLDAGLGVAKVFESWRAGDDWEYELIKDVVDIGAALAIGTLTAMAFAAFVGGGWVVCLVAGAVAGAGSLIFDHYGNNEMKKKWKPAVDKFSKGFAA